MEQQLQHEDAIVLEKTAPASGDEAPALPLAGPWRRWFARLFDLWWEVVLIGFLGGFVFGQVSADLLRWLESPIGGKLFGLACVPLALLLDAGLMAALGNTPGKALLGMRVGLVDGRTPGFFQLCRRNLGVWVAGFGLGLPLINLLTMARQYRKLREGEQASYDEDSFRVRARPIGWIRRAGFFAAFLVLFAAMVALEHWDREDTRKTAARNAGPSFQWTNPGTGRTVSVAPQWSYQQTEADDGMVLHQFTQYSEHAVVILSSEDAGDMSLPEYARAWTDTVSDSFKVPAGSFGTFRGMPSWTASGKRRDDATRIQVRLLLMDGQVWRVMAIQSPPVDYTDDLVDVLAGRLWDTVLTVP